jgi:inner membrane protein
MIFAHGPLGFLAALMMRARAHKAPFNLSPRQWYAMLVVAFVGGIFPDIDLFYYYGVDASTPHREFITHTPILYIVCFAIFGAITWALKKRALFFGGLVFTLGTLSHLVADTIVAKIMFFYPLSHAFYGVADFGIPLVNNNLLFWDFLLEGIVFVFFFYTLIRWFVHTTVWRITATTTLLCVFTLGVATLILGNAHVYHGPNDAKYGDIDNDGIVNYADRDLDGDGMLNIDDLDADNDNKGNPQEIIENAENFLDVWYDPSEGGFAQIPARLGLVTNHDVIWRLYESIGVQIETEMAEDYARNTADYATSPADENFDRNPENIAAWLKHVNRLETDLTIGRYQIGDILFFADSYVTVVTGFTNTGQPTALDVHRDRPTQEKLLADIITLQGAVTARGKMLDSAPLFAQ